MVAVAWGASWPEEKEGVKSREAVVAVGSEELWKRSPPRAVASTKAPSSTGWPPMHRMPVPGSGRASTRMPVRTPPVFTTKSSG